MHIQWSRYIKIILIIGSLFLLYRVIVAFHEIGKHQDKIWLHRCNSLEKLQEMEDYYLNIEVDIVIRRQEIFDITHDPDTTFRLNLDNYFAYLQGNARKMWLDIKNLTPENTLAVRNRLNELLARYHIAKERLIIESSCWQALAPFTRDHFYTSLYVTYDKPSRLTRTEIAQAIEKLQEIVDQKVVRALSFPGWWYTIIKSQLHRPIDLLTWKHRTSQFELYLFPGGQKMLDDPQLKVILIKDKGHYHR